MFNYNKKMFRFSNNFDIIYMFKNSNLSQNDILTFGENVINFIGNQMMEEKWKKE